LVWAKASHGELWSILRFSKSIKRNLVDKNG
jgi:hypothetical protein